MPQLTLYHFEGCSYCTRVKDYLRNNGIKVPMKDIQADPANRAELIAIGGMGQVPCLVIDGTALYESLDIIEWFKQNWK